MSTAPSRRTSSKTKPTEANENELGNPVDPIPLPPPRPPLNSIQLPIQNSSNGLPSEPSSAKSDNPIKGIGATPKSAQSIPARAVSKVSHGDGSFGSNIARERGCSSRFSGGIQDAKSLTAVQVPYFELKEDPSFWEDRNVQVLIRIRPISSMESALQGHRRCLFQESSQTLTWTGHPETRFTFDHVACETMSQEKLFSVVGLPMVDNCMLGYNSCMFAYGQTGSGKTYTMMGEIHEMYKNLSEDLGMTPRIFEYLFTRIREEEERQSDEQLKYSCKCSFLEIYNEQITDLLEPSSTNLQLREDIKKGVYVENLKEYEVSSVKDVMELLLQGAANRKMAATHMNSESSRSHSVFTCVIESRWEKDSMTHLRFGRLNLVDLAGSERQKSSGAEGERLKEAANINRSLSTLGLVIMTLVDITNGKTRHVPYRDSRLTFLLQDSLGGNSKTTVIANVSPSICSASETLSTLKFAQRAKLIQNNAKVNEDASGDVMALQQQIQKLKDQLTTLIKHQNFPRSLCYPSSSLGQATFGDFYDDSNSLHGGNPAAFNDPSLLNSVIKQLEAALISALRREEMAEAAVKRLEAEIKHMNRLVHQREDDTQRAKTLLRFREEKLRRLELLADDLVSSDGYLMEENVALSQEIQLLRERIDRNPELTQFALENMRLLEQLRIFQNFYQQGERDTLLSEVSHLRNHLLKGLEGKFALVNREATKGDDDTMKDLDNCRRQLDACLENNAKLTREVDDLRCELKQYLDFGQNTVPTVGYSSRDNYRLQETDKESSVELILVKEDSGDGIASSEHADRVQHINAYQGTQDIIMQFSYVQKELRDAKLLIKAMESQHTHLLAELDDLKQENKRYLELSRSIQTGTHLRKQLELCCQISEGHTNAVKCNYLDAEHITECGDTARLGLHATLERMHTDLEEAKILNKQLRDDHASQLTCHHEMVHVQEQVEAETAKTILYLQEELAALQQEVDSKNASKLSSIEHSLFLRTRNEELDNRLCFLIQENVKLSELVAAKDAEISALSYEWEKAIIDLTTFLIDGRRSLDDASEYIESVVESFPHRNVCINEHVERAMQVFIEKETLTADLQKRLEDAQEMGLEMKSKLNSLRGATLAITEVQQLENDENSKELFHLKKLLGEKVSMIQELESIVKCKEDHIIEAEKVANSSFEVIKKLYEMDPTESLDVGEIKLMILKLVDEQSLVRKIKQVRNCDPAKSEIRILSMDAQNKDVEVNIPKVKLSLSVEHDSVRTQEPGPEEYACALQEIRGQVEMAILRVSESNNDLCSFYTHTEKYLAALLSDINSTSSAVRMLFHDSINVVRSVNKKFRELREVRTIVPSIMIESSPSGAHDFSKSSDRSTVMQIIVDEVAKANERLNYIKTGFDSLFCDCRKLAEQDQETYRRMNSHTINATDKFEQYVRNLIPNDALLKCLMEEAELAMSTLMEIHFQLSKLLDENDVAGCSSAQGSYSSELPAVRAGDMLLDIQCKHPTDKLATTELCQTLQTLEERMDEVDVGCSQTREILQLKLNHAMQDAEERTKQATGLLMKFEEAQETVEEAELVLKALLRANEGAKHEKDWWKQVSAELLAEKTALIEEVQRLEASNFSEEKQYGSLQDQIHASLTEILGLTSSLRGSFQQIQGITGEELNVIYSGIFSFGQELLQSISTSRSWVEDMMSEVMEKGFALFVLYQCHRGALLEQIMHLNTCSDFAHYKHVESCSVIRNEDILDKNMMLEGMKDREVIYNHRQFNSSSLGETGEVLNACQIVQHTVDGPVVGTNIGKYERPELLSDQNCSQERAFKLERDNLDLTHDMELVKEMTGELAIYSDKFLEELTSKEDLSVFINFPAEKEKTEMGSTEGGSMQIDTLISSGASLSSSMCEDNGLPSDISQGNIVGHLKSENGIHANMVGGVITDIEALLHDVQHLKTQFAQLISSQSATKDCSQLPPYHKNNMQESSSRPMYIQKGETGMLMLSYSHAKTVGGNQSIQALNKLENNLRYLISLFYPGLRAETEKRSSDSLLERSFEGICSIEVKVYKLLERCLRYGTEQADIESNNLSVKRELARKDNLIKGLLFDLRLLQESTSNVKGMKDEIEEMTAVLSEVQNELAIKTAQIDKILAEQEVLEAQLAESEAALSGSRAEVEQAQKALIMLSDDNTKLKLMLEDAYIKKTHTEELLEHKMKVIEGLQREILSIHSSVEGHIISSVEGIMDELRRVSNERDHLQAENVYLNDKLEMASALADENEAIAVEAHQVAEASKIYAEQKEEEVKVLESSVEELEGTINILERKVNDMKEEVESHQLIRKGLELEVEALTHRMLTVENAAENLIAEYSNVEGEKCQIPRRLDGRIIELCEARKHIEDLEMEKSYTAEEIKQYREHISELVLHSEAQSSLYQEKFKALEAMVSEVKPDPATSNPSCSVVDKTEKISVRTRGSGSPFRCISSLVQQMNLEKDQELSAARCRIEELEVLAANRQKEICMLTARLAAVDSMTHDVIRDLMGVKLDMTNYANLIDQEQLQKLLEKAQEQIEETDAKEKEILKLKKQIDHLIEERESWVEERDQRRADILASEVLLERLQQRDQFLTAQNEMLKMDKVNLHQKIAELDEKVKFIVGSQSIGDQIQQPIKIKENSSVKVGSEELSKRLAQSDKLLSHMRTSMKNKGS